MKIIITERTVLKNGVIKMSTSVLEETRKINIDYGAKMARRSQAVMQNQRKELLKEAIDSDDMFYLERELRNISTYELFKILLQKLIK